MNWRQLFQGPLPISIALHVLLIVAVFFGWESTADPDPKVHRPNFVEAKLVELEATDQKQPAAEQTKVIDLTKKRERERQQAEAERRAREEAAREKAEAQKREREAEARRQREAEKEREREKAEAERRAREEAARQKAEQERREELAQQRLEEALEKEERQRQAAVADKQRASYVNMISARIEQNWSRPPSARRGMKCELLIQLVPTGEVVNVTVVESSGNPAFDRSAEQAVRRVDRFSELQDMSPQLFEKSFRELTLVFNPKDLRL